MSVVNHAKEEDMKEEEDVQEQDGGGDGDDEGEDEDKGNGSTHAAVVADLNEAMKPQGEREAWAPALGLENSKDETKRTRGRRTRTRTRPRREEEDEEKETEYLPAKCLQIGDQTDHDDRRRLVWSIGGRPI